MKSTIFNQGIQLVLNSCFCNEPDPKAIVLGAHLFKNSGVKLFCPISQE